MSEHTDQDGQTELLRRRRWLREWLLIELYVRLGDDSNNRVQLDEVDPPEGFTRDDVEAAAAVLEDRGQAKWVAMPMVIGLTPLGVADAEQAILPEDDPLAELGVLELRRVEEFTSATTNALDDARIEGDPAVLEEIRDLLLALQAQHRRPRRKIIGALLAVIQQLAMNTIGSAGGSVLVTQIGQLLRH